MIMNEHEIKLDEEIEEPFRAWTINGERYAENEIEETLKENIASLFREYDSGETEENLVLVGVKMYREPATDGKISLLVEFDSKNPENRWREDSLFNALNEEGIELNGMKVEFNPIAKYDSGTIEQYLEKLQGFGHEEGAIQKNAQKLEEKKIGRKLSEIDEPKNRVLPLSIIDNREKGRVNIKFDTVENNPDFNSIIRELKANGWKYAPSSKQWYPAGNAVNKAEDFANRLQEKYSLSLIKGMEKPMDIEAGKSPYDGIRFFDRNYNEAEEFAGYFNDNLHLLGKANPAGISNEQASVILKAAGYENSGTVGQRRIRVGLDDRDNIVILSSSDGHVNTRKLELPDFLNYAKEKSAERVSESKKMLETYMGKNTAMKKDLQDIFTGMYKTCIGQSEEINAEMQKIYGSYLPENKPEKSSVLYQRNSYRGWEISADKNFTESVYCRPFEQPDRSGYVIMAGWKNEDDSWSEKFVRELLHTEGRDFKYAVTETVAALTDSDSVCGKLGIKYSPSAEERLKQLDIISADSGKSIKNEFFEPRTMKAPAEKTAGLYAGEKFGNDVVTDVYRISEGVYQAALSSDTDGAGSVRSYFVLDGSVASQLVPQLQELLSSFDGRSVIENKTYEPYIIRELIAKSLMPPRDENYVQKLDDFISAHPLRYEKLKPVNFLNFERKLQEIAEADRALKKTPFELGQQLMDLVDESEKPRLNKWLISKGCDSRESMAKVFESWLDKNDLKPDRTKQKDNGYPPRGEQQ